MKTSTYKPVVEISQIEEFLVSNQDMQTGSLIQLTEGHVSQAFSFESYSGEKFVIRIGKNKDDFLTEEFVYNNFASEDLLMSKILEVGDIDDSHYYCISQFIEGMVSDTIDQKDFNNIREDIESVFASSFKADVGKFQGYGNIDYLTGNGKYDSW